MRGPVAVVVDPGNDKVAEMAPSIVEGGHHVHVIVRVDTGAKA